MGVASGLGAGTVMKRTVRTSATNASNCYHNSTECGTQGRLEGWRAFLFQRGTVLTMRWRPGRRKLPTRLARPTEQADRARRVEGRNRAARWATTTAVVGVLGLLVADVLMGPGVKYVGILVAAPFLAAVFARARVVVAVGVLTILLAWGYGELRGVGDTATQWVRLVAIAVLTATAAVSAKVRWRVDEQLGVVRSVADAAQQALLRPLMTGPGVEAAVRYVAAQESSRIGGDIYDVTSTTWGTRALLGDVRGKGLDAVALGSDVLGAWRYLAPREADVAQVIRELDAVVSDRGGDEDFVTAVVLEVSAKGITVYNCGHPDPVVVGSKGARYLRTSERALPLGMGSAPVPTTVGLHPWTNLLVYTDGLSEARDSNGSFFDPIAQAPAVKDAPLEDWLDELFASLSDHVEALDDDVAALVLRVKGTKA